MSRSIVWREHIRPILAEIRTVPIPAKPGEEPPPEPVQPFLTLSREPGAGAWTLARELVQVLNARDAEDRPWTCWDRELVEKVAADCHVSAQLIESLEEASHSWLQDIFSSLSLADTAPYADEAKIYGRMAATIRALAQAGRVVIVGMGAMFITRHMPGGIHLRLVAPFEHRVSFMARQLNITRDAAAAHVKQLERNRLGFYRRYWSRESFSPESFALTINTALVDARTSIEMIAALVRARVPHMQPHG